MALSGVDVNSCRTAIDSLMTAASSLLLERSRW
jgi:hypothetical protein